MFKQRLYLNPESTKEEIQEVIAQSNRGFVNKVGDLLQENTIKRREKLKNVQFILSFSEAEIITAYNIVAMHQNARWANVLEGSKKLFPLLLKAYKFVRENLLKR